MQSMDEKSKAVHDPLEPIIVRLNAKSSGNNQTSQEKAQGEMAIDEERQANGDNDVGCVYNVKLIAVADILLAGIVIVVLAAYLIDLTLDIGTLSLTEDQVTNCVIVHTIGGLLLTLLLCELWCTSRLIKATKSIDRKYSMKKCKRWLLYNIFLQLMILASIAVCFLFGSKPMGAGGMGYFIIRMMFYVIVFRYYQELNPALAVAVGPEHEPIIVHVQQPAAAENNNE